MSNLMSLKKIFVASAMILALAACSKDFNDRPIDAETGFFPESEGAVGTFSGTIRSEVIIEKPLNFNPAQTLLYVKNNFHGSLNPNEFENQVISNFLQMDVFQRVVTKEPTVYINADSPANFQGKGKWYDVVNPYSYRQLNNIYRGINFVVAEVTLSQYDDDNSWYGTPHVYIFEIKFVDPKTAEVLFYARGVGNRYGGGLMGGVDDSLIYPVFNEAIIWLNQSKGGAS